MSSPGTGPAVSELESLLADDRLEELEERLARELAISPDSAALLRLHARAASQRGDLRQARLRWADFRQQHPGPDVGYILGAETAHRLGLSQEAEQLWGAVLQRKPDHPVVLAAIAQAALDANEVQVAARRWLAGEQGTHEPSFYRTGANILLRLLTTSRNESAMAREVAGRMLQQPADEGNGFVPEICARARPLIRQPRSQSTYRRLRTLILEVLPTWPPPAEAMGPSGSGEGISSPEFCRVFFDSPDGGFDVALQALVRDSSRARVLLLYSSPSTGKTAGFEAHVEGLAAQEASDVDADHLYDMALVASAYSDRAFETILHVARKPGVGGANASEAIGVLQGIDRMRARRTSNLVQVPGPSRGTADRLHSVTRRTQRAIRRYLPQKRLRIAICVSGQLRGYDRALPTWQALGLSDHDVTYFVHVWRHIGRKKLRVDQAERSFSGRFLEAFIAHASGMSSQALAERYPSLVEDGSTDEAVTESELQQHYGSSHVRIEDDAAPEFAGFSNQQKMYYKIAAVHQLYRESAFDADLVLRIRPDKPLASDPGLDWTGLLEESSSGLVLFADAGTTIAAVYSVGDQVALAVPEVMDGYAASYGDTIAALAQGRYGYPVGFRPHENLAFSLFQAGITARTLEGVRMEPPLDPSPITPDRVLAALELDTAARQQTALDRSLLQAARADAKDADEAAPQA